jgi:predicted dehydrogenase
LLQHEEVDAAWITVPPGSHGEIEMSLVERGIPFFVEKPLSADRRTGEEIAATVASKGIIAGVGYHWRAMDSIPEVKRTLAGKPAHMVCAAWHDATPPPVWWRHQATSGGQMVEQATHLFDIARFLVGEACVTAAAAGRHERPKYPDADVDDVSAALLRFNGGAIGVFTATCLLGSNAAVYVQLMCEGLLITVTQGGVTYDTGRERREVRVGNDPGVAEDRAFLEAVRRNDPTLLFSSYADALLSHRLTHDVLEASR